jgi:hypothetical protein
MHVDVQATSTPLPKVLAGSRVGPTDSPTVESHCCRLLKQSCLCALSPAVAFSSEQPQLERNWRTGRSPKENRLKAKKLVSPEPENKTFSSKAVEKRKLEPPAQRRQSRFGGRWA